MAKYAYRSVGVQREFGTFAGPFGRTSWDGFLHREPDGTWVARLWGSRGVTGRGKTRDAAVDDAYGQQQSAPTTAGGEEAGG